MKKTTFEKSIIFKALRKWFDELEENDRVCYRLLAGESQTGFSLFLHRYIEIEKEQL